MRLVLHPKVYSDIDEIMGYYERVATRQLADEFWAELRYYMQQATERPQSFAIRERELRRVNLQRFPYHFLVSYRWRCRANSCRATPWETSHRSALAADNVGRPSTRCALPRFRNSENVEGSSVPSGRSNCS
jgi:hypothetical protein